MICTSTVFGSRQNLILDNILRLLKYTVNYNLSTAFVEPPPQQPIVTIAASVASVIIAIILLVVGIVLIITYIKVRTSRKPLKIVFEEPAEGRDLRGVTSR